jgi:hypothetical protein
MKDYVARIFDVQIIHFQKLSFFSVICIPKMEKTRQFGIIQLFEKFKNTIQSSFLDSSLSEQLFP